LQIQHTLSVVCIPRTSSYFTLAAVLLPDRDLIGLTGPARPISGPHETLARFFIYVSHTLTFCVCYKHICDDRFANAFEFTLLKSSHKNRRIPTPLPPSIATASHATVKIPIVVTGCKKMLNDSPKYSSAGTEIRWYMYFSTPSSATHLAMNCSMVQLCRKQTADHGLSPADARESQLRRTQEQSKARQHTGTSMPTHTSIKMHSQKHTHKNTLTHTQILTRIGILLSRD
jgi:hypothetical protein